MKDRIQNGEIHFWYLGFNCAVSAAAADSAGEVHVDIHRSSSQKSRRRCPQFTALRYIIEFFEWLHARRMEELAYQLEWHLSVVTVSPY